jgi:hypothetical protein
MRKSWWLWLLIFVMQPLGSLAATKQQAEQPDKEMLRMMDFLKDWEVINNMEMMKDLQQAAPETGQAPQASGAREPAPLRKKEAAK